MMTLSGEVITRMAGDHPLSQHFLRFGPIPTSGKSRDHLRHRELAGLSVYHVRQTLAEDGSAFFFAEGEAASHPTITALASDFAEGNRPAFLVSGLFVGYGPDGEPLVTDAVVVQELFPGQLNDAETRIGRALWHRRCREIAGGNDFHIPEERRHLVAFFRAFANEQDPTLSWHRDPRFRDGEVLERLAREWYFGG